MFIDDTRKKIDKLYSILDNDFIGITDIDKSKLLIMELLKLYPSIRVIEHPNFVMHKSIDVKFKSPPGLDKIEVEIDRIAFTAAAWRFSDIQEVINTFNTLEFIYLYSVEVVKNSTLFGGLRTYPSINQSTFIIIRMIALGWTDIIIKGLKNVKF